ncbi:MAG: transcription-repair coupling factor [Dehalococcoidia bacterium]
MAGEVTGIVDAVLDGVRAQPWAGHFGALESAKPLLAAAIARAHGGPVLYLAPTPARAGAVYDELLLFAGAGIVGRLPERERLPYELTRDDAGIALERGRALRLLAGSGPSVVVASWAAIAEHAAPVLGNGDITITVGVAIELAQLLSGLEGAGYEPAAYAEQPGAFARRGGIIDIFPVGQDAPVRLELFGSEVESIRVIDLATQRSTGRLDTLVVPAVATSREQSRQAAGALLRALDGDGQAELILQELELIAGGQHSDHAGFFEPLLASEPLAVQIPADVTVIVDDRNEGAAALERAIEHMGRARAELEGRGQIPTGLPSLMAPAEAVAAILDARTPVFLDTFGADELGAKRLPIRQVQSFAGKLRPLASACKAWAANGHAVVVVSQQALRLAEIFDEEGVRSDIRRSLTSPPQSGFITLVPGALSGGLIWADGLYLVTDAEIFGLRKRRRPVRTRKGIRRDLVATLEVGDYVVHADHGIARYAGLIRRSVEGVEREYLELQYADNDRLYVPADQVDALSPYIGPADHPPSLTRLGTMEWSRAKRRVRQAVIQLAHELLELYARRELAEGHAFAPDGSWQMEMEAAFPFVETPEQLEAIAEVKADMERSRPMDRLICGDVGYGKTEVAIRAAFKAVADGKQVAVLVPTTVLAEQHGATFRERTAGFPVTVEVLSRFRNEAEQRDIARRVTEGAVDIAVGTHRLLQKDIAFKDLGLVIIDEEQRFGVAHKERLKQMRAEVDTLTLSATPIPRTLQMSLAGIRDMSTIMSPPEERLPIRTYVLPWDDEIVREAIEREMERGGQVYFVHNRVLGIERLVRRLQEILPEASIVVGHGQMPEEQLERVMLEFAAGDHDILVCTTIIESGLDIPNVNTIIINNADYFGLSQLYQLRGRVGRGAVRAYAYLLHEKDRSLNEHAQKRLEAIFEASELGSGFQIALRDLEIRGAGNVLGNEQSGHIADVGFDLYSKLVAEAVAALKQTLPDAPPPPPSIPPPPLVDLPVSAHIPESFISDIHARLALYQRIAALETAQAVAEMQEEIRDRFGPPPPALEQLLYLSLAKSIARKANVEAIKTDEQMFHIRVRGGVPPGMRLRVEGLKLPGVLVGPNQVRLDRVTHARNWMATLIKVLRAMSEGRD